MGAISEKLVYLNGTKQAIKQAINEDFEVIDNNTTFREYAEEISSNNAKYKDLIPKETTNATNTLDISNSSGLDKALVTQYGNTYQETTTGKNLFDNVYGQTGNVYTKHINAPSPLGSVDCYPINLLPNTQYTLKIDMNGYQKTGVWIAGVCFENGDVISLLQLNSMEDITTTTFTTDSTGVVYVGQRYGFTYGETGRMDLFLQTAKIQLEKGSTATDYEPYTNGASPNPDYPQEIVNISGKSNVKVVGKNLFDKNAITERSYVLNDGTLQTGTSYEYNTSDFIPVQPNTTYYKTLSLSPRTKFYDANKQVLDSSTYQDISIGGNAGTFTTPANAYYFRFTINTNVSTGVSLDSVILYRGDKATDYEPYQEQSFDLDLKSKNLLSYSYNLGYSTTINGITWTINQDGSITANGTASSLSIFNFADVNNLSSLIGKEVTFNGTPKNSDNEEFMGIYSATYAPFLKISGGQEGTITITPEMTRVLVRIPAGYTVNNLTYYPMLRLSSITDDTYEQYHEDINLCKIDTYKDRIYKSTGKNLFDKNNANIEQGGWISTIGKKGNGNDNKLFKLAIKPSTTYTIQKIAGNRFRVGTYQNDNIADNIKFNEFQQNDSGTSITITSTPIDTYLYVQYLAGDTNEQQLLDSIQVEENSTATTYEGYGKKWYLEKKIGKVVLDGSENWGNDGQSRGYTTNFIDYHSTNALCNIAIYEPTTTTWTEIGKFGLNVSGVCWFRLDTTQTDFSNVTNWKNWLTTNNAIIYYILATPTTTEITESNYPTLYNQLNNIKLFEGVNHITMTNESGLDVEFDITYYKDWKLD